jgi:hypothetical protein
VPLNPLVLLAGELAVDLAVELAVEPHGPSPSEIRWLSLLCVASHAPDNTPSMYALCILNQLDATPPPPPPVPSASPYVTHCALLLHAVVLDAIVFPTASHAIRGLCSFFCGSFLIAWWCSRGP